MSQPLELPDIRDPRLDLVADFLAWCSYVLAFFPAVYGVFLLIVGDAGWGRDRISGRVSDVYETALQFPGAPESWAIVAVILSVGIAVGQWRINLKLLAVSCILLSVWFFFFAVAFLSSWIENDWYAPSLLPSVAYTTLGLLSIGRARMAWGWRELT